MGFLGVGLLGVPWQVEVVVTGHEVAGSGIPDAEPVEFGDVWDLEGRQWAHQQEGFLVSTSKSGAESVRGHAQLGNS